MGGGARETGGGPLLSHLLSELAIVRLRRQFSIPGHVRADSNMAGVLGKDLHPGGRWSKVWGLLRQHRGKEAGEQASRQRDMGISSLCSSVFMHFKFNSRGSIGGRRVQNAVCHKGSIRER